MFSKVALFVTASFAISAIAGPLGKCNTGPVQCCQSLQAPTNADVVRQLSLIGVIAQGLTGQVGLQCNPITVVGTGNGANCVSSPVCCEKNFSNSLIGINCTPINVSA